MNGLLIGGIIGESLKSFTNSYGAAQDRMRQQAEADEDRAMRRQQLTEDAEYKKGMLSRQTKQDEISEALKRREQKFKEAQEGLEFDEMANTYKRVGKPLWQQKYDYTDELIRKRDAGRLGGKPLPSGDVMKLAEGDQMTGLMSDVAGKIKANKDVMGPWVGRIASFNPYDTRAQIFDSEMKMAAQKIGTYLESGKMTDKDVPKYRAMLPNITDTPEVAEGKRAAVEELLRKKRENDAITLQKGGYRTKGLMNVAPVAPKVAAPPATKATPVPGAIITRKDGKRFQVGADGESLTEIR